MIGGPTGLWAGGVAAALDWGLARAVGEDSRSDRRVVTIPAPPAAEVLEGEGRGRLPHYRLLPLSRRPIPKNAENSCVFLRTAARVAIGRADS